LLKGKKHKAYYQRASVHSLSESSSEGAIEIKDSQEDLLDNRG